MPLTSWPKREIQYCCRPAAQASTCSRITRTGETSSRLSLIHILGDTGSLTLGGIIGVFAVLIRKELLLPILCGVFFVEALSVIAQVTYFKYTKRKYGEGKRIFKMTPLHHHYQKPGDGSINAIVQKPTAPLTEPKIVTRFWLVGMILVVIALATLKMR